MFAREAVHGLSVAERRMLFSDVILDAGGRLEGHGAARAFVEQFTVSLLDVRLDRVQSSEHHQAAGASAGGRTTKRHVSGRGCTEWELSPGSRGTGTTPVSNTAHKVQTRLVQVCLEQQLVDTAPALRADVRFAASVDALVSCGAAAVGQEHRRGALGAGLQGGGERLEF